MNNDEAPALSSIESGFAWLAEGSMPRSQEDRVAEAVALIALLFSISVGIVIAMLPTANPAAAPSNGGSVWKAPARPAASQRLAAIDDSLADGRCLEGGLVRPCVTRR